MRATIFHQAGQPFEIATLADRAPGPSEAIIAVSRAGMCRSNLHATQHLGMMPEGLVLGHEFAGSIAASDPQA